MNSEKSLLFDSFFVFTDNILFNKKNYYPNVSSYIQFDCECYSLSDIGWFLTYVEFYFPS